MAPDKDEDPMQRLVESFRSLLDDTLIVAIANDYDLHSASGYQVAEEILNGLSQDVALEEATGFDPSGTPGVPEDPNDGTGDDLSTSATSTSHQASHAQITDSSSTGVSSNPADIDCIPRLTLFNNDSEENKFLNLRAMFSELKEYDISHALKKANGDFQVALDDLLNVQYLQSTGQQPRGIDGFFQPEGPTTRGKKKSTKTSMKHQVLDLDCASREVLEKNQAKELKHQDEIAFLSDRIDMSYDQVSGVYYRKKCSSGAAAAEILDQYIALGIRTEDDQGKARAKEFAAKYPNVPEKYFHTLVQVTGSVTQFSEDISALLSKHFAKNPWKQRLDLSHRLTPLPAEELEGSLGLLPSPGSKPRTPGSNISSRPSSGSSGAEPANLSQAVQRINESNQERRDAESYVSHLSRRGASNSLYKQAAVVYRERVHEHAQYSQQMTSAAADLLVERQSTPTSVDLHGVTVRDGARIARQKVLAWWQNLGEYRTRKAREQPYTVITGLGRHSASGVSQLRQAVAAALLQDGWRMKVETGRFVVSGRR